MARVVGPAEGSRTIQTYNKGKQQFAGFPGRAVTLYTDTGRTTLADVRTFDPEAPTVVGAALTGSKVSLGADSRMPKVWFPDGVTKLYGKVSRGPNIEVLGDSASSADLLGRPVAGGGTVSVAFGAAAAAAAVGGRGAKDSAGHITVTALASPVVGVLATVTFATAWAAAPKSPVLVANNAATAGVHLYVSAVNTTTFEISCAVAPGASAALDIGWLIAG